MNRKSDLISSGENFQQFLFHNNIVGVRACFISRFTSFHPPPQTTTSLPFLLYGYLNIAVFLYMNHEGEISFGEIIKGALIIYSTCALVLLVLCFAIFSEIFNNTG